MQEFAGYVQESQGRQKLMDRLSSSVRQAQTSLMLKDVDPEFAKQLTYFSELGDKMSVLERIGARLHNEREVLQTAQDDFSVALFHWAANEQVMTQPLQKLANCVEHCSHHVKKLVRTSSPVAGATTLRGACISTIIRIPGESYCLSVNTLSITCRQLHTTSMRIYACSLGSHTSFYPTQNEANTYSMMVAVKEYQLYSSSAVVSS